MGAGLLAMVSLRCTCQTVLSASQASQLPQVMHGRQNSRLAGSLWERACPRWYRCGVPARPRCLHRRQASSHRLCKASRIHGLQDHCGSGLARDGIAAVYLPDRVVCIAGKPAPTGYAWPAEFAACQNSLWERLARDAGGAASQSHLGDAIAGKPAPTDNAALTKSAADDNPCGSGLEIGRAHV